MSTPPKISFEEAWRRLDMEAGRVIATLATVPPEQRADAADRVYSRARQIGSKMSAKYHTDVPGGGDIEKFHAIWEAISAIEWYTEDYKRNLIKRQKEKEQREASLKERVFIKIG